MTPLAREIAELIATEGPISLARYMGLCLAHPRHGYYVTRDPLGRAGDFTTSPEISQMFGEMLGVWVLSQWDGMGRPAHVHLVELGPGRGTLMADLLRTTKALPAFRAAVTVHLVEISPALRERQKAALETSGLAVRWHDSIETLPEGPIILIANEFFDALPVRQFQFDQGGWHERLVGRDEEGALQFGLSAEAARTDLPLGEEGDIREICPDGLSIMTRLAERVMRHGGGLLAVDYGYARSGPGDTFQAMKGHAFVHPLAAPGEADLTAHVDFAALGRAAGQAGARAHPLITQRALLMRLGIEARAAALMQGHPNRAGDVEAGLSRLIGTGEGQMGCLFKALAVSAPGMVPPAFDMPDPLIDKISP